MVLGELYTNCYIVTDEATGKVAVVDPGDYDDRIAAVLAKKGRVDYILLTHGHFDHIGGAERIRKSFGAKVVISQEDAELLSDAMKNGSMIFCGYEEKVSDADIIVKDGDIIEMGSIGFKVMLTPGHTRGSVCFIAENSIFSGDTLFANGCGRCDMYGGDARAMLTSLKALADLDGDYNVYPGHGSATTLQKERNNNPYIRRDL